MPAGRPSTYDPSICADIPAFFTSGASKAELAVHLGISRQTLWDWEGKYPEFSEAIKRGVENSEAWWVSQGRVALREREFNHVLWYMNMKNRFGWSDKQEITGSGGKDLIPPSDPDEVARRVAFLLSQGAHNAEG